MREISMDRGSRAGRAGDRGVHRGHGAALDLAAGDDGRPRRRSVDSPGRQHDGDRWRRGHADDHRLRPRLQAGVAHRAGGRHVRGRRSTTRARPPTTSRSPTARRSPPRPGQTGDRRGRRSRRPASRSCARSPATRTAGHEGRGHGRRRAAPRRPRAAAHGRSAAGTPAAPRSPTRTRPPTPSATPRRPQVLRGHASTTSTCRSSRRTSRSPTASSSTPGRSAARCPGPTIRVHLGDTVNVHLTNQGSMSHSIDFHASQTAMNHQMVEIKPGATFTYTFTADYAGVWMYHCGTAPALHHIANGMFGMVIVEPKGGLPKVDEEFAFVQSEWYLGAQGEPVDYAKANRRRAGARLRRLQRRREPVQGQPDPGHDQGPRPGLRPRRRAEQSTARSTSSARSSTRSPRRASSSSKGNAGGWG